MAAIDLRAASKTGWVHTQASVATTWQQYQIPSWCNQVTVLGDAIVYVAGEENGNPASSESPADGGAVGTHRIEIPASTAYPVGIQGDPVQVTIGGGAYPSGSIFVAAKTGTATVTLHLERV